MTTDSNGWVEALVQVQGDSLVVQDEESGDVVIVDLVDVFDDYDPYNDPAVYPYDRAKAVFGTEVMEEI